MTRESIPFKHLRRSVEALVPYARNARVHSDAQVATIAASIREFGFTNPVLIDGANNVVAGHGRILAARKLGMKDVPCIVVTGLSEAQRRALVLADNRIALSSTWDDDLLRLEIADLHADGFELMTIGFDPGELADLLAGADAPLPGDTAPDDTSAYKEQYGVIVMCRDAAEQEEVYNRLHGEGLSCKVVTT